MQSMSSDTSTEARSVQPFLHGVLVWSTDRQTDGHTDHATSRRA